MTEPRNLAGAGSESTAGETAVTLPDAPAPFTEHEARQHTKRVQNLLDSIQQSAEYLVRAINEANEREAWKALGYPSWTAYVSAEFADPGPHLDRDNRRKLVDVLAQLGMSTRAIAPVVGASPATVARDVRLAGVSTATPEVTGRDGKTYTRPKPPRGPVLVEVPISTELDDLMAVVDHLEGDAADLNYVLTLYDDVDGRRLWVLPRIRVEAHGWGPDEQRAEVARLEGLAAKHGPTVRAVADTVRALRDAFDGGRDG